MAFQLGKPVIWNTVEMRPIVNVPMDAVKVRIRMRPNQPVTAFVKFKDRIEKWIVGPEGKDMANLEKSWELAVLQARNWASVL